MTIGKRKNQKKQEQKQYYQRNRINQTRQKNLN